MLYRRVRALLRLHDIPCGAGDCTMTSLDLARYMPGAVVIFGYLNYNNRRMDHAWVQLPNGTNIDPICGVTMSELGVQNAPAILIWTVKDSSKSELSKIYCTQIISPDTSPDASTILSTNRDVKNDGGAYLNCAEQTM